MKSPIVLPLSCSLPDVLAWREVAEYDNRIRKRAAREKQEWENLRAYLDHLER